MVVLDGVLELVVSSSGLKSQVLNLKDWIFCREPSSHHVRLPILTPNLCKPRSMMISHPHHYHASDGNFTNPPLNNNSKPADVFRIKPAGSFSSSSQRRPLGQQHPKNSRLLLCCCSSQQLLLQFVIASLLGCSSAIFAATFYSLSQLEDEPTTIRLKRERQGPRPVYSAVPQPPQRGENYRFGDQSVVRRTVTGGNSHNDGGGGGGDAGGGIRGGIGLTSSNDDFFSENLPEDHGRPSAAEQQRPKRQPGMLPLHDQGRLQEIEGGLFSEANDGAISRRRKWHRSETTRTTLFGYWWGLVAGFFLGQQDDNNNNYGYYETRKSRRHVNHGNLAPPPIPLNHAELRMMQRSRIREWERQGIFYNYSRPAIRQNTTLPLPLTVLSRHVNDTILILVLSSRSNHGHREAIRATWGYNHSVVFVVGGVGHNESQSVQKQLMLESQQYGDILDSIHSESYISLPYKLHFGYQWAVEHMKQVQWIVKADDDTVVRVATLQRALLDLYNPTLPIVLGRVMVHALVSRKGKWAEFQYEKNVYPYWPQGSRGHVVSRPVADYLARQRNLIYYQGEDTSLGIWLDESPLNVWWIHSPYFQNHGLCQDEESLVIGHKLTPEDIHRCYARLDEWTEEQFQDRTRQFLSTESRRQRHVAKESARQAAHKFG